LRLQLCYLGVYRILWDDLDNLPRRRIESKQTGTTFLNLEQAVHRIQNGGVVGKRRTIKRDDLALLHGNVLCL
jgi:hypothetical protein